MSVGMTTIAYSSLSRTADLRDSITVFEYEETPVPERQATCITCLKGDVSCNGDTSIDYEQNISDS
jgi:hypothetical protein